MYNSWDAHYRKINVLCFTQDGAALVAGSEDSGVTVWSIPRFVSPVRTCHLLNGILTLHAHGLV